MTSALRSSHAAADARLRVNSENHLRCDGNTYTRKV